MSTLHEDLPPIRPPREEFEGFVRRRLASHRRLKDEAEVLRIEEALHRGLELLAAAEEAHDPD